MGGTVMDAKPATFEHYNVAGIDPGRQPLPEGPGYTFELTTAELKGYGDAVPQKQRLSIGFSVVGDPTGELAGRMNWVSLFPGDGSGNDMTAKKCNVLAAQSGIRQTEQGEEGFAKWLRALGSAKPRFTGAIRSYTKRTGEVETEVDVLGLKAA